MTGIPPEAGTPHPRFAPGQLVRHRARPEWGVGRVRAVDNIRHEGKPAQRVRAEFPNRGILTLNTAVAPLEPASDHRSLSSQETPSAMSNRSTKGWLNELEGPDASQRNLWDLPPDLVDPFTTPQQKLEATLTSYRFNTDPGPLFEWAVIQTGLDDPLSRHTRVELEQAFPRFARDRDNHLRELVKQLKRKNEHEYLRKLMNKTQHPPARSALEKAIRN